jgi:hypothetical protein
MKIPSIQINEGIKQAHNNTVRKEVHIPESLPHTV